MVAIASPLPTAASGLRRFDVRRDLHSVADLVEQCFADTLDADGRRYIEAMRRSTRSPDYWYWATANTERSPLPPDGFVWQENGRLVGNLSLIPFTLQKQRCYLIANVAVSPHHRRQGIARSMTVAALEQAKRRGAYAIWLHVRAENRVAFDLYHSMEFRERARRTTWESVGGMNAAVVASPESASPTSGEVVVRTGEARHWPQQRAWLERIYPAEVNWHLPYYQNIIRPDLWGGLYRLLTGAEVRLWAAQRREKLLGVLAWHSIPYQADFLWLATSPPVEDQAIHALLPLARRHSDSRRRLILDYPASRGVQALHETGFRDSQTLIWMERRIN